MGVEYKHFLIPAEPSFIPSKDAIHKLDAVLEKWKLKAGAPTIYNLADGTSIDNVDESLQQLNSFGELAICYKGVDGIQVKEVFGESHYGSEMPDEEQYIERIVFIFGEDYKIHPSSDDISISVIKPPVDGIVLPSNIMFEAFEEFFAESYKWRSSRPPQLDIRVSNEARIIGNQNFHGYWHTAIMFDFGKSLPALSNTAVYEVENKDFLHDIEAALGTKVIHIGELY